MNQQNQINEVKEQLQTLIDSLLKCEKAGRTCKKCKIRKNGCLKEIRASLAVALQFISVLLPDYQKKELPKIYS